MKRYYPTLFFVCLLFSITGLEANTWTLDPDYMSGDAGVNGSVHAMGLDSQNRLVVGGLFSSPIHGLARFHPDGSIDDSFHFEGIAGGSYPYVTDLIVLPDDSILIVGDFQQVNGDYRGNIARILPDGSLDEHFATGDAANAMIRTIEPHPDGGYMIGGNFSLFDGERHRRLARVFADGTLDASFQFTIGFSGVQAWVDEIAVDTSGRILAAGTFYSYNGHSTQDIARINTDGSVDESFSMPDNGIDYFEAMEVLSNGQILVGGTGQQPLLYRLNSDGSVDGSFTPNIFGEGIFGLLPLADGRIVVTGDFINYEGFDHINFIVLNADGTTNLDTLDLGIWPNRGVGPMALADDGMLYFGGYFTDIDGEPFGHLARLQTDAQPALLPISENAVYFPFGSVTLTEGQPFEFELAMGSDVDGPGDVELYLEYDDPLNQELNFADFSYVDPDHPDGLYLEANDNERIDGTRQGRLYLRKVEGDFVIGSPSSLSITIVDDDVPGTVWLEERSTSTNELVGHASVTLRRYENDPNTLNTRVLTTDGSAVSGVDYDGVSDVFLFAEDVYSVTIPITVFQSSPDISPERDFTVSVLDYNHSRADPDRNSTSVTIHDKDDPASLAKVFTVPNQNNVREIRSIEMDRDGALYALVRDHTGTFQYFDWRLLAFDQNGEGQELADLPQIAPYQYSYDLAIGPDDMLYVAGRDLFRYTTQGTRDTSYQNSFADMSFATANKILPLPDGKCLVAGQFQLTDKAIERKQLIRLNQDGTIDDSFILETPQVPVPSAIIYEVSLAPDGYLYVIGSGRENSIYLPFIYRFDQSGLRDKDFDGSEELSQNPRDIEVAPDGNLYLGIEFSSYETSRHVIKMLSDGSEAPDFSLSQNESLPFLLPDSSFLGGGKYLYFSDGSRNTSYSVQEDHYGFWQYIDDMLLGPDGLIYLAGNLYNMDGAAVTGITAIKAPQGIRAPVFNWQEATVEVGEGIGTLNAVIAHDGPTNSDVGVFYTTVRSNAEGETVAGLSGYRRFEPGESSHTVPLAILDNDQIGGEEEVDAVLYHPLGGALLGTQSKMRITLLDDDGDDLASWQARYFPANPKDTNLLKHDDDHDGLTAEIEWLTGSHPRQGTSAHRPVGSLWQNKEASDLYLTQTFYFDAAKTGYRTLVEASDTLAHDSWETIWNSEADPGLTSSSILTKPESGAGWLTIRDTVPANTSRFIRVRYEALP